MCQILKKDLFERLTFLLVNLFFVNLTLNVVQLIKRNQTIVTPFL